jgi:two-component system CheB/CheR fusion protein
MNEPKGQTQVTTNNPDDANQSDSLFIVAIGASAGGLETLKSFFMQTMPNEHIAYVIITHLSPDHISVLPELLQQYTSINVLPINDQQRVLANHIYVLPPGKQVAINHGILELIEQKSDTHTRLPIDFFLSSLAQDQGEKVICVILSGMGQDGTLGLRAIQETGGMVIAQTVQSALYEAMPKSAINTGLVDYILLPEDMYAFILKYIAHFKDKNIVIENNLSAELKQILAFIKNQTQHDFSLYKTNTIFRRIQKRLDVLQINNLSDYVYYLHQHSPEITILFKELLINVTSFFRDPEAFDRLKKELMERVLVNKTQDDYLRVWVAGCSTGEEVYSIAIIIFESMSLLKINCHVQIFATDIDEDAIEIARAGVFPKSIKTDITPERLDRFFIKENDFYKINPDIRKMIIFAVQNIIKDPPFTKLDLLSCRNLLIYLSAQLQKKILPLFHYSLHQNGLLFLGTSETISGSADFFNILDKKWKIFLRNESNSTFKSAKYITSQTKLSEITSEKTTETTMPEIEPNLSNLIKTILLKYYTPACVVIDEKGSIVYVYGRTSKFLEFAPGEARLHLLDMIRPELKSKLHSAIHNASTQQKEISLNNLQIKTDDEIKYVHVKIRPLIETELFKGKLLLIVFEEIDSPKVSEEHNRKEPKHKKITELEQELKYTKENLQTTIEELETSNEELKSSNEELQSTNEELQSTNEEIETSKEELQSLNEELSTVNAELENRIDQLSSTNDDIKNLLDNTEIATIFLDKNLCIKRFTPKATEIINLISTDVGRPISHIVSNLHYDKLIEDSRHVLKNLQPITTESIDKSGHWYVVRIIPYRTLTNVIDGVVITFLNIHAQKQAEDQLEHIKNDMNLFNDINIALLNTMANSAVIIDNHAKVLLVNQHFLTQFKIQHNEIIGHNLEKKLNWDTNKLKILITKITQAHPLIEEHPLELSSGQIATITMRMISSSAILLIVHQGTTSLKNIENENGIA